MTATCAGGGGLPARYILSIMGFLACMCQYMMRVNLSVAIVSMVGNLTTENHTVIEDQCPPQHDQFTIDGNSTNSKNKQGEFQWDEELQGLLLGAFFWGYILPQVFGGRMAEKLGGKHLLGGGMLIAAVSTALTPMAARTHIALLFASRILCGVGQGVVQPSLHALLGKWAPPNERSRLSTMAYAGQQVGVVVGLPLAGILCDVDINGGWPLVFYLFAAMTLVWYVGWLFFVFNCPEEHPRISPKEREYILTSLGNTHKTSNPIQDVPWKKIFTSLPVWAIIVGHVGQNWGFYTLLTQLPTYMKNIMGFDIKLNAFISALPYLLYAVMGNVYSFIADMLIKKEILSVTVVRKLFQTIGLLGPASCLLAVTFVGCDRMAGVVLFVAAGAVNGAVFSGFQMNHLDVANNFAGTMLGITNTIASIPGILAPYAVGAITHGQQTHERWNIVFYITCCVYVTAVLFYLIFGSGQEQSWNRGKSVSVESNGIQMSIDSHRNYGTNEDINRRISAKKNYENLEFVRGVYTVTLDK